MRDYCQLYLESGALVGLPALGFDEHWCQLAIELRDLWADVAPLPENITLDIELRNSNACHIWLGDLEIKLVSECNSWPPFLEAHFQKLVDPLLARLLLRLEGEDFLLVQPSEAGRIWVLVIECGDGGLNGRLVERSVPASIDTSSLMEDETDQRDDLERLFADFQAWLGDGFLGGRSPNPGRKLLSIKVDSGALWFLRFPLSAFCHLGYGSLAAYRDVEWIVSAKSFLQSCHERVVMEKELLDLTSVIQHSVVILNEYQEHDTKLCKSGTDLVVQLLSCLRDIELQTGTVSLRWYCNPTAAHVTDILVNPETYYFFADFEASSGQWEPGQGEYQSWDGGADQQPRTREGAPSPEFIALEGLDNRLRHIRLMRVFHCNSIFDLSKAPIDWREPADSHSIVRRILDCGVQRVEGGMTEESYCDYLCSLIYLFYRAEHFRFALQFKLLERGFDPNQMTARVNQFLKNCHRDVLSE